MCGSTIDQTFIKNKYVAEAVSNHLFGSYCHEKMSDTHKRQLQYTCTRRHRNVDKVGRMVYCTRVSHMP